MQQRLSLSDNDLSAYRSASTAVSGLPVSSVRADIGLSAGKWYFEISTDMGTYTGNAWESAGICSDALDLVNVTNTDSYIGVKADSYGHCFRRYQGSPLDVQELRNNVATWVSSPSWVRGTIGIAVDLDAGKAWAIIDAQWTAGANPVSQPAGRFTFTPGTKMYPAITILRGIGAYPDARYKLNAGQSPFSAASDAAFAAGGVLAGFNKGWWSQ